MDAPTFLGIARGISYPSCKMREKLNYNWKQEKIVSLFFMAEKQQRTVSSLSGQDMGMYLAEGSSFEITLIHIEIIPSVR